MLWKIGFLFGLLILSACHKKEEAVKASTEPQVFSVRVLEAVARNVDKSIDVTGSLAADETVSLSFEVPGRIANFRVDFGQQVRKGDVIAELDKRELEWQLERAQATLAQTAARLGMKSPNDPFPTKTASMRQAEAQLEDARSKLNSAQTLLSSGDIAKERATELEKALDARKAVFDAAQDELNMMIAQLRAQKVEVELATKRLSDAILRAPFDGGISAKLVSPGQYVKDNVTVVTLVKTSPLRLRVEVPENYSARVRVGSQVSFTTDAAPGKEFYATIQTLNPSIDSKNRTLVAEGKFNVTDSRLRPGGFVQVRLVTEKQSEAVLVPNASIFSVAGLNKVFVIRDGKAKEIRMTPGFERGGWSEVPAGTIQAGEKVAVSNLLNLVDGALVKVL
ncbi:MAG: efflux RND transporter periplasmic adaptor subunit [Bryobacter sp.]|nr:efflux RND transporter periplasmic adaptor subunit [Bryobacter sp.]